MRRDGDGDGEASVEVGVDEDGIFAGGLVHGFGSAAAAAAGMKGLCDIGGNLVRQGYGKS